MPDTMPVSAPAAEAEYAAFLALDWGDQEHAWALQITGQTLRERGKLEHTPEAVEVWAAQLAARFPGQLLAVGLEQSRGALIHLLSKYSHLILYPIHPATAANFRTALFPSGSKDDPKDADLLLDLITRHRDRLRPLRPDSAPTRKLQALVEHRRQLVEQRTAQTNRITDLLKLYFPQILGWLDKIGSPMAVALLQRWSTLEQLQAEDPGQVRKFFRQHNSRSRTRIEQRIEEIQKARPALLDRAVIEPCALMVRALVEVVVALNQGILNLEHEIEHTFATHADAAIFQSFPGAGPALAPRLLAAFGSQRDRFATANQLQSYAGIAPVIQRSGVSQYWVHFRWACPKFLRQSFHEYAASSLHFCPWAKAFYDRHRNHRHKSHHAAVRALAFKWMRILFRCWHSHTPYREELFTGAQTARLVPLTAPAPTPAGPPRASLRTRHAQGLVPVRSLAAALPLADIL